MRAVNYLKNRFEFAVKTNPKNPVFKINQNDIDALNQIIDFLNTGKQNTDLEDSLLLFYLLQIFKIDNEKGKVMIKRNLSNPFVELEKLIMILDSKKVVIDNIFTEIRTHQLINGINKENLIKRKKLTVLIEDLLSSVRNFKNLNY